MTLEVPADLEAAIEERVRAGLYRAPDEVIRAALRLLAWAENDPAGKRELVRLANQAAVEGAERGDDIPGDELARWMRDHVRGEQP